jgi:hypothetical protein
MHVLCSVSQVIHAVCVTAIFSCVVKVLYNLLYFQVAVQLSCHMTDAERAKWRASKFGHLSSHEGVMSLDSVMALIIGLLEQTHIYQLEDQNYGVRETGTSTVVSQADRERMEMKVCVYMQKPCRCYCRAYTATIIDGVGLTTGFIGSHTVTHNYSVYTL